MDAFCQARTPSRLRRRSTAGCWPSRRPGFEVGGTSTWGEPRLILGAPCA